MTEDREITNQLPNTNDSVTAKTLRSIEVYISRRGLTVPNDHESFLAKFEPLVEAVFHGAAERLMEADMERNPLVEELFSIYASVSHNAGPYYQEHDVPAISLALAEQIFPTEMLADVRAVLDEAETFEYSKQDFEYQKLMGFLPEKRSQKPHKIGKIIQTRMKAICSMDTNRAIPLILDPDGFIVWDQSTATGQSQQVMEWIRQDNADKFGANKYRVRSTTYTRTDSGWASTDWIDQPNYWATELRERLQYVSEELHQKFPDFDVILVTEGGVFKGTVTPGTDIDTACYVVGNVADFPEVSRQLEQSYASMVNSLPFPVKEVERFRPRYKDRASGKEYWERSPGEFVEDSMPEYIDGTIRYVVRQNEQGILVFSRGEARKYRKPPQLSGKGWYLKLALPTGELVMSQDQDFPRTMESPLRSFQDEIW